MPAPDSPPPPGGLPPPGEPVSLDDLQRLIRAMFGAKDEARGAEATFLWFAEEVGELAAGLRSRDRSAADRENLALEFADVLAWLATLANIAGVDLSAAVRAKYGGGCPGCGAAVCACGADVKP